VNRQPGSRRRHAPGAAPPAAGPRGRTQGSTMPASIQPRRSPGRAPARGRAPPRYGVWAAESRGGRRAAPVIRSPAAPAAHPGMAPASLRGPGTPLRPMVTWQAVDRRQPMASRSLGCRQCSAAAARSMDTPPPTPQTLRPGTVPSRHARCPMCPWCQLTGHQHMHGCEWQQVSGAVLWSHSSGV
jgi:hypothetical protein